MSISNSIFEAHRKKERTKKQLLATNDTMTISNEIFERYRIEQKLKKSVE
tara:strand:+ start:232 stop:381 length:150 start_codon:yes stop_codon:yes gene_type:complete